MKPKVNKKLLNDLDLFDETEAIVKSVGMGLYGADLIDNKPMFDAIAKMKQMKDAAVSDNPLGAEIMIPKGKGDHVAPKMGLKYNGDPNKAFLLDEVGLVNTLRKQRCYIGIDNGVSGSIGIIREDGSYAFYKTPTRSELNYTKAKAMITRILPIELAKILSEAGAGSMVMIERPMVNPTRFKATVSALRSFEATITILETLGLSYEYCDSKEWQRPVLPKGITGDDLKPASLDVGNRLYPDARGVKHPDRDGMLISHYCKSKHR